MVWLLYFFLQLSAVICGVTFSGGSFFKIFQDITLILIEFKMASLELVQPRAGFGIWPAKTLQGTE